MSVKGGSSVQTVHALGIVLDKLIFSHFKCCTLLVLSVVDRVFLSVRLRYPVIFFQLLVNQAKLFSFVQVVSVGMRGGI